MANTLYTEKLKSNSSPYGGATGARKFGSRIDSSASSANTDILTDETGFVQALPPVAILDGPDSFGRIICNPGS